MHRKMNQKKEKKQKKYEKNRINIKKSFLKKVK